MPLIPVDVQAIPMVHTEDASSLVSDSGFTRYRMKAKVWDMYLTDSTKRYSYWHFPKGIYVEQFDSLFHVTGSIAADTAYYFEKNGLWQAIGNVVAKNIDGTTFETPELFWDSKAPANSTNVFYTHQKVKITSSDGSFQYGNNGFRANQSLNPYFLFSVKAEINVEESPDSLRQNPNRPDSLRSP